MSDKKKGIKPCRFAANRYLLFICFYPILKNSKTVKAFELSIYPVTKKVFAISRVLITNTANVSPTDWCHHLLIFFVFFFCLFSFLVRLSVPRIDDRGVEIAIKAAISHVVFLFYIICCVILLTHASIFSILNKIKIWLLPCRGVVFCIT
jgi:hypothetical protein